MSWVFEIQECVYHGHNKDWRLNVKVVFWRQLQCLIGGNGWGQNRSGLLVVHCIMKRGLGCSGMC